VRQPENAGKAIDVIWVELKQEADFASSSPCVILPHNSSARPKTLIENHHMAQRKERPSPEPPPPPQDFSR
jgi:hypothetical protein